LEAAGNKNDMERKKGAHKLMNQIEKLIKNSDVKNIEKLRELE